VSFSATTEAVPFQNSDARSFSATTEVVLFKDSDARVFPQTVKTASFKIFFVYASPALSQRKRKSGAPYGLFIC